MNTCKFCQGELLHQIEKGMVETYELTNKNEKIKDSLNRDVMIDLNVYEYCPSCKSYHHQGFILDGRNTLAVNLKVFDAVVKKSEYSKPLELFSGMLLINFSGGQIIAFYKAIKEIYEKRIVNK